VSQAMTMDVMAQRYAEEPVQFPALQVVDLAAQGAAVKEGYRNMVIKARCGNDFRGWAVAAASGLGRSNAAQKRRQLERDRYGTGHVSAGGMGALSLVSWQVGGIGAGSRR